MRSLSESQRQIAVSEDEVPGDVLNGVGNKHRFTPAEGLAGSAMTPEQLDTVGYCQYPWSDAAEVPFIAVIWAGNLEFIHHMAEIALLRDLYRTRPTGTR